MKRRERGEEERLEWKKSIQGCAWSQSLFTLLPTGLSHAVLPSAEVGTRTSLSRLLPTFFVSGVSSRFVSSFCSLMLLLVASPTKL